MAITPGTRIGTYEVTGLLGAGGMGEVYRARDSKLHRDVALKVLPEAFALEPDRLARFKREAQVLASLNHPNIAAIYGFEDGPAEAGPSVQGVRPAGADPYVQGVGAGFSRPVHALVLELVEGPTLADRIAQGAIPLDEALPIARQISPAAGHDRTDPRQRDRTPFCVRCCERIPACHTLLAHAPHHDRAPRYRSLATWREQESERTGTSQGQIVRDQLEKARTDGRVRPFMRLAGVARGARDLSNRTGFGRR